KVAQVPSLAPFERFSFRLPFQIHLPFIRHQNYISSAPAYSMYNHGGIQTIKKLMLVLLALFAVGSIALAAGPQGIHEPGTGLANPETKEAGQGSGQGMMAGGQNGNATAQQGIHEPGTGLVNPELKEAAQGTGQGLAAKAENVTNESAASASKTQPGFEAALALFGIIAASFGLLPRKQ
ncbi:MAG TPA: hypothetical protein PKL29_04820, partial [Methanothrix sp.]|nr:hypothetical protein [Methanothrix sp.]